ncbi:MAG: hypothetical protein JXA95_05535 [Spirochaetales bacterium]|nr:hypothetical protein [Spirochaetales bacterium]
MGQFAVIVILLAIQVLAFLYFRMMIRRELSRENRIDSVRREIEQLIIELDRTADRNVEIVENRIAALKEQIRQGERIIRLIETEQEKRDTAPPLYTDLAGRIPEEKIEEESPASRIVGVSSRDEDWGIEVIDGRERALELYRQGMDAALIASSTGLPRGEVELIISLNKKG